MVNQMLRYEHLRTYKVINGIQPDNAIKLQAQKKRLIIKSIAFNKALLTRKTNLYKSYTNCIQGSS